jgi:hypothetical protein
MNDTPFYTYTDGLAITDGTHIDLTRLERARRGGIPAFNGKPVTRMTDSLILALLAGVLVDGANDTAAEGEPDAWLYELASTVNGEKVWLQDNGDGWTIMLASDY